MGHIDALNQAPTDPSENTKAEVLDEWLKVLITSQETSHGYATDRHQVYCIKFESRRFGTYTTRHWNSQGLSFREWVVV